jgi:adenylate cyclase
MFFFLRGMQQHNLTTREGLAEAIRLADRALEVDPRFGFVAALKGTGHRKIVILGYAVDPEFERKEAVRLLRLALTLDDNDPETLALGSATSAWIIGDCEGAIEMADRAVALNPNSYAAWSCRGWVYKIAGLPEEAVSSFERAIRMSPVDPALHMTIVGWGSRLLSFVALRKPSSKERKPFGRTPPIRRLLECGRRPL